MQKGVLFLIMNKPARYRQKSVRAFLVRVQHTARRIVTCAIALYAISLYSSCNRQNPEFVIIPPSDHPLSRPVVGYGVIVPLYTNLSGEPEEDGGAHGYLRRGSVVRVLERRLINRGTADAPSLPDVWVFVDGGYQGWLRAEEVAVYDYEEQADTASKKMVQ